MTSRRLKLEREQGRLDGPPSAACQGCVLLQHCGGWTRRGSPGRCTDLCRVCGPSCDRVCLNNPDRLTTAIADTRGLGTRVRTPLRPPDPSAVLPAYIPVVHHPSGLSLGDKLPWMAIPLPRLFNVNPGVGTLYRRDATEAGLRRRFGVGEATKLLLLGPGPDEGIEQYWADQMLMQFASGIGRLGFSAAIPPNYSMWNDDPRPEHLVNRRKSLLAAARWSRAGVGVIPYIAAVADRDYAFWETVLEQNPEINIVSKEFRTGLQDPKRAARAIEKVAGIQERLARPLHLVAISAFPLVDLLRRHFDQWTIVDSQPFLKAQKRRRGVAIDDDMRWDPALGEEVGKLFDENLVARLAALDHRRRNPLFYPPA